MLRNPGMVGRYNQYGYLAGAGKNFTPWNFVANPGMLPNGYLFSRASAATVFDNTGTMSSVGNDVPRWDATYMGSGAWTADGILIEGSRTNTVTNSDMEFVVPGSPGSSSVAGYTVNSTLYGLTRTLDKGTNAGMKYGQVALVGTTDNSGGTACWFLGANNVQAATPAENWVGSFMHRFTNSSNLNGFRMNVGMGWLGGTPNSSTSGDTSSPNGFWEKRVYTAPASTGATNMQARIQIGLTSIGVAMDLSHDTANPQWEQGATFPSSYIPTTGATASRAADALYASDMFAVGINQTGFTIAGEILITQVAVAQTVFFGGSGPTNISMSIETSGRLVCNLRNASTNQVTQTSTGIITAGTVLKFCVVVNNGNVILATNVAPTVTTSYTMPTLPPAAMFVGSASASTAHTFGKVRKFGIKNTPMTQAEAEAMVATL